LVHGLTTAATLWFATVLGICLGGGQLWLGISSLILGLFVLEGLKWIDKRRKQDRHATLLVAVGEGGPTESDIAENLKQAGFAIGPWTFSSTKATGESELRAEVHWRAYAHDIRPPKFLRTLLDLPGVSRVEWKVLFRTKCIDFALAAFKCQGDFPLAF
jgi:putative Mg2+ transporter-C (MgtC) family protein